jgi:antitoxin VapB
MLSTGHAEMVYETGERSVWVKVMSLEIRAPKADALARELAAATGEDIDTAVVRAIEERLARTPRRQADDDAAIEAAFGRLAQMRVLDCRSPDEIIGYGPDGLSH